MKLGNLEIIMMADSSVRIEIMRTKTGLFWAKLVSKSTEFEFGDKHLATAICRLNERLGVLSEEDA